MPPARPGHGRALPSAPENGRPAVPLAGLAASDGDWAAAARELGLHRSNLHHLARRLGVR